VKSHWILAPGAATCVLATVAAAQAPILGDRVAVTRVVYLGSEAEDAARLDQLRGRRGTAGWMLRTPTLLTARLTGDSTRVGRGRGCDLRWALVSPRAELTWNSRLPFERNMDGVWSGRGVTTMLSGGAIAECGRLRVAIVPDVWYAQNRAFPILASAGAGRSAFNNPFYSGREASADLPLRFGSRSLAVLQPGQSSAELDAGYVTIGAGSEPQWWGPALRNGLVMTNHAAGIPSVYLRTSRPVHSRLGNAEARWMVGALTESPYFDVDPANDLRSISGLIVTLSPAFDTTLTLGVSRVVYAPIPGALALPARFLDAVARWGPAANVRTATFGRAADQLSSIFGRWVVPSSGFEAYAEWARVILPASLRSLLLAPQYSQGYTVGAQWLSAPDTRITAWRAQVEATMLEQPRPSRTEEPPAFYVSTTVAQGYTQRGRAIGAMIGTGGSSQFLAVDRRRPTWTAGLVLGRIRWNNEQYYRRPSGNLGLAHDVSLYAGLRGRYALREFDLSADIISEKRLNYLFQSNVSGFGEDHTFDVANLSLRFAVTPR
jgi:hypothetical protein